MVEKGKKRSKKEKKQNKNTIVEWAVDWREGKGGHPSPFPDFRSAGFARWDFLAEEPGPRLEI